MASEVQAGGATGQLPYGGSVWDNATLDNVLVDDTAYIHVPTMQSGSGLLVADYFRVSSFGFGLSGLAVIDGIEYRPRLLLQSTGNVIRDGATTNNDGMKAGKTTTAVVGAGRGTAAFWPATATVVPYGTPTDLWGTTWTPSEINDNGFSTYHSQERTSFSFTNGRVEYVEVTVHFTIPPYVPGSGLIHAGVTRDAIATAIATGTAAGLLQIFDSSAVKLVEFDINGWGAPLEGAITANPITGQGAITAGVADNYIITMGDGSTPAIIGTVTDAASTSGLVIDNVNIGAADVVSVTSLIYTAAP